MTGQVSHSVSNLSTLHDFMFSFSPWWRKVTTSAARVEMTMTSKRTHAPLPWRVQSKRDLELPAGSTSHTSNSELTTGSPSEGTEGTQCGWETPAGKAIVLGRQGFPTPPFHHQSIHFWNFPFKKKKKSALKNASSIRPTKIGKRKKKKWGKKRIMFLNT